MREDIPEGVCSDPRVLGQIQSEAEPLLRQMEAHAMVQKYLHDGDRGGSLAD